ncbi:unnamed protein product [Peronospora farinosa]|uniref:SCP domain-containing protein n=1 Tax=Peronospora farinosa TaxID=134698 RepID=A0AAV0TLN1_9STRA|nr:unnamed protein product [Peronospora farinosa]CAI5723187.1 unnamed protein product [Peronospora farinosa]
MAADSDSNTTNSVLRHLAETETVDYHVTMLNAVNRERAAFGLPKLCLNNKLRNAALLHSRDMAKKSFMSHTGSNGSTMSSRAATQRYRWTFLAENVAAGHATVASVVASWMKSKPHRANILSSKVKMFECGYAYNLSSKYKHYWTQDFASGSGERCN